MRLYLKTWSRLDYIFGFDFQLLCFVRSDRRQCFENVVEGRCSKWSEQNNLMIGGRSLHWSSFAFLQFSSASRTANLRMRLLLSFRISNFWSEDASPSRVTRLTSSFRISFKAALSIYPVFWATFVTFVSSASNRCSFSCRFSSLVFSLTIGSPKRLSVSDSTILSWLPGESKRWSTCGSSETVIEFLLEEGHGRSRRGAIETLPRIMSLRRRALRLVFGGIISPPDHFLKVTRRKLWVLEDFLKRRKKLGKLASLVRRRFLFGLWVSEYYSRRHSVSCVGSKKKKRMKLSCSLFETSIE